SYCPKLIMSVRVSVIVGAKSCNAGAFVCQFQCERRASPPLRFGGVNASFTIGIDEARSIAHQATCRGKTPLLIDRGADFKTRRAAAGLLNELGPSVRPTFLMSS